MNGVIPKDNQRILMVDNALFAAAVDRVATISEERSRSVKVGVERGRVVLTVRNMEAGQGVEELEVDYDGEAFEIGFNARYLLDVAGQIQGEDRRVPLRRRQPRPDPGARPGRRRRTEYVLMPPAKGLSARRPSPDRRHRLPLLCARRARSVGRAGVPVRPQWRGQDQSFGSHQSAVARSGACATPLSPRSAAACARRGRGAAPGRSPPRSRAMTGSLAWARGPRHLARRGAARADRGRERRPGKAVGPSAAWSG